jgi:protein disulfide-isomerase A1
MFRAAAVFLALLVASATCSDVLVLTTENFDATIASTSPILVEFYAPWCGHCKSLAPEYEKAATALAAHGLKIAKVDATEEEELGNRFGVRGFPTLKLFKNGAFSQDYSGARTADAIVEYMVKKSGPSYTKVSSVAEVNAILEKESHGVVVGYFSDVEAEIFDSFEAEADADMRVKYLVFNDAAGAADCMLNEVQIGSVALVDGNIAVVRKDGHKALYHADTDGTLKAFVSANAYPLVLELDPELFQAFLPSGSVIVAAFPYADANSDAVKKIVNTAAHASNIRTFLADSAQWGQAFSRMGASGEKFPTAIAFVKDGEAVSQVAFDEEGEFTAETVTKFFADVAAGTAVSWKKSEPIPESNDGPVTVVVAKTYDQIVHDATKDVLIEYYAPWCGHCKRLEPIYVEVGEHFANDNGIVIAKIDATANFVDPKLGVRGFPTLKFVPAGENADYVDYEEAREKDDIIAFINKNRKTTA